METQLEQFRALLLARVPATADWARIGPIKRRREGKNTYISLMGLEVGFVFNADGRLIGGFNWKQ